jgi:hypothetical protein
MSLEPTLGHNLQDKFLAIHGLSKRIYDRSDLGEAQAWSFRLENDLKRLEVMKKDAQFIESVTAQLLSLIEGIEREKG